MHSHSNQWRFSKDPRAFLSAARFRYADTMEAARKEMHAFDDQGFMGAKEAAAFLGIPLRSLYQYVRQGLLPSYKLGRHRLFRRLELLNTLRGAARATRDEILR